MFFFVVVHVIQLSGGGRRFVCLLFVCVLRCVNGALRFCCSAYVIITVSIIGALMFSLSLSLSLFRTFLLGGDLVVFLTLPKILAIVISCYVTIGMLRVFHTHVWLSVQSTKIK